MWACVMGIFLVYAIIFILFEDYDKHFLQPFDEVSTGICSFSPLW